MTRNNHFSKIGWTPKKRIELARLIWDNQEPTWWHGSRGEYDLLIEINRAKNPAQIRHTLGLIDNQPEKSDDSGDQT